MVQLIVQMLDLLRPVFQTVLTTTLYVTVLIGFIFLAKWLLKDRLNVRWHYLLWLLVVVRLILPWTPESSFSLYNFVDFKLERSQPIIQTESPPTTPVG